jgi:hypothetical protein
VMSGSRLIIRSPISLHANMTWEGAAWCARLPGAPRLPGAVGWADCRHRHRRAAHR